MAGGRKSKYSEELVEQICTMVATTGSDRAAYDAVGLHPATFYRWLNEKKEFNDRVESARAEYRETCPDVLVRQANKAFSDYLHGRMERIVTTTKSGTKGDMPFEEESIQRIPVGVPKWAIDRVLGNPSDEIEALKTLVKAGWLPRWITQIAINEISEAKATIREVFAGILPDGDEKLAKPGLSDAAAAAIRARILGIEDDRSPVTSAESDPASTTP